MSQSVEKRFSENEKQVKSVLFLKLEKITFYEILQLLLHQAKNFGLKFPIFFGGKNVFFDLIFTKNDFFRVSNGFNELQESYILLKFSFEIGLASKTSKFKGHCQRTSVLRCLA